MGKKTNTAQKRDSCPACGHPDHGRRACVEVVKQRVNGRLGGWLCGCTHRPRPTTEETP